MKKCNNLTFGLFNSRGIYFWRNIKDIPIFFKRIAFVIKHGYYPQAQWETFLYFIDSMKEILNNYRFNRNGTPLVTSMEEHNEKENDKIYNERLDKMVALLDQMDEDYYNDMDIKEYSPLMLAARDEFFEMFKNIFYDLWD